MFNPHDVVVHRYALRYGEVIKVDHGVITVVPWDDREGVFDATHPTKVSTNELIRVEDRDEAERLISGLKHPLFMVSNYAPVESA